MIAGEVRSPGWEAIEVEVLRDGEPYSLASRSLAYAAGAAPFALAPKIAAGLYEYDVTVRLRAGSAVAAVAVRANLVSGDAYLVTGQSLAEGRFGRAEIGLGAADVITAMAYTQFLDRCLGRDGR